MGSWHRGAALAVLITGPGLLACVGGTGDLPEPEEMEDAAAERDADADQAEPAMAPQPPPAPGLGPLPLAVGHTWTWEISERVGAGPRIFGFATKKPQHHKLADWTLAITGEEGGRYEAHLKRVPVGEELPNRTDMTLWDQDGVVWMDVGRGPQPALEIALPPDPVSAESVRCVAHVLGGVVGRCAARPGGAMGAVPGVEEGVVAQDLKPGAEVGQFLVGLMSVGMFIPGNQSKVQTATRTGFTPGAGTEADFQATPGPVLTHVLSRGIEAKRGLERSVAEHGVDAEQGAAVVARIRPEDREEAAGIVLASLSEDQRYPVVRTALSVVPGEGPLHTLARLRSHLPDDLPEAQEDALLGLFELEVEREGAVRVLSGDLPLYTKTLAGIDGPFDSDRLDALESALPGWEPGIEDAAATVALLHFDDGRRTAIERLLPLFDEGERARAVAEMSRAITFDDAKLELYRDHAELLKTLPASGREALVAEVGFAKDEARETLGMVP